MEMKLHIVHLSSNRSEEKCEDQMIKGLGGRGASSVRKPETVLEVHEQLARD